jgi:hypothetical protein
LLRGKRSRRRCFSLWPIPQQKHKKWLCSRTSRHRREDQVNLYIRLPKTSYTQFLVACYTLYLTCIYDIFIIFIYRPWFALRFSSLPNVQVIWSYPQLTQHTLKLFFLSCLILWFKCVVVYSWIPWMHTYNNKNPIVFPC